MTRHPVVLVGNAGTQVHAPENTRTACLSAYVAGADAVLLPIRLTRDDALAVLADETIDRLTGESGRVADLSLKELRAKDFGKTYHEADGSPFQYPARVESLAQLLDFLPRELNALLHLKPEPDERRRGELISQTVHVLRNRGMLERVAIFGDADIIAGVRKIAAHSTVGSYQVDLDPAAQIEAAVRGNASLLAIDGSALLDANGGLTPVGNQLAQSVSAGQLKGALLLWPGMLSPAVYESLREQPLAWGIAVDSLLAAGGALGSGRPWIDEKWAQQAAQHADVNADIWHLGYAKHNVPPCIHVYPDNGIHVAIEPFEGPLAAPRTGNAILDAVGDLTERSWYALKDWPFYAGGGVGFALGIDGDFSAEVDIESARAQQATTVEMAALNVDPAAHRKPWVQNDQKRWVANYTTSARDRHTFFDPHGGPPYVGVEHDEDDGWRINWNLGTDYESNQYGKAFGDGKILTGRVRLDRRGPYFAAYYRATGKSRPLDWVCVGAVRNDSLNPKVYLRVVGKRWRQENPARPDEWMPVISNHFIFRNMTITRFDWTTSHKGTTHG